MKLKNIDYKAFFIEHAEKIGMGVIALIVVMALASTSWSRCEKTPDELKAKVTQATNTIESPSNVWPKEKQDKYVVVDYGDKARTVFTGLNVAAYEFSTPMFYPLYRKKEKAKEPEYLPPINLIASGGEAILGMNPVSSTGGEAPMLAEGAVPTETAPVTEGYKDPNSRGTGAGPGLGARPDNNPYNVGGAMKAAAGPNATAKGAGHGQGQPNMPATMTPENYNAMRMSSGGGAGIGGTLSARGVRYVAIRGIVPLKEQTDRFLRALNLPSYADASNAVEYTDFVLERQTAVAGPNPWSGKWETVKIDRALEVLSECSDFDPDPVPADLQDAVITMGLPYRLLKYWGDDATHPNIKNFELKEEDREREMKLQAKMLEEFEKLQLELKPKVERKGLIGAQNDLRGMSRELQRSSEGSKAFNDMSSYMATGNARGMTAPDIQNRLTASGRLYLFRYFDFDVQPGMAYRYRVKLQLKNPNFERPYEEVENPDFTRDPYRETGWSNISSVAVVPESVHYYLKDVERDPVLDDKSTRKAVANISMFEWDPKIGTMLASTLRILSVGNFIGGESKRTTVLDPSIPSLEEKDVKFVTEDVLLDSSADLDLTPELHPDLALKPDKGRKETKVGVSPEALVVTSMGQLKELDPYSHAGEEQGMSKRVPDERKPYEYLKDAPKEQGSKLDANNAYRSMMGQAAEGPGGGHGSKDNKKNPRKGGGAAAGGMPGMPNMPGMGGRMPPAPPPRRGG